MKTILLAETAGGILPAEADQETQKDRRRGYIYDYLPQDAAYRHEAGRENLF